MIYQHSHITICFTKNMTSDSSDNDTVITTRRGTIVQQSYNRQKAIQHNNKKVVTMKHRYDGNGEAMLLYNKTFT